MEAIEIVVFIAIAMIAGGLIVYVITSTDFRQKWSNTAQGLQDEEDSFSIDSEGLADAIAERWERCRYGLDERRYSVYVRDNMSVTRETLVREFLKNDRCDVIDCRNRTGGLTVTGDMQTPKIINIQCTREALIIS